MTPPPACAVTSPSWIPRRGGKRGLVVVARRGDAAHAIVHQLDLGQGAEIEVLPDGGGAVVGKADLHVGLAVGRRGIEGDLPALARLDRGGRQGGGGAQFEGGVS